MKKVIVLFTLSAAIGLLYSCKKSLDTGRSGGTAYLDLPAAPDHFYDPALASDADSLNKIATLGRVLFYDNHLSVNNSVACASCHKQEFAFADNVAFSRGFENRLTGRNSMPIQNLGGMFIGGKTMISLFWDARERNVTDLVTRPITNHVEMGISDLDALCEKLATLPYYPALFKEAFHSEKINAEQLSKAISTFMFAIRSEHTRMDQRMNGQETLTAQELRGEHLFTTTYQCSSCHELSGIGYMGENLINIGLDYTTVDKGFGAISGNAADMGRFKTPNLRNIALTAPYMHDGRFPSLESVLEHYSHGIQNHPNLDIRLKDSQGHAMRMNISDDEKKALIAFLNTLTDYSMITDQKFSNPFKVR